MADSLASEHISERPTVSEHAVKDNKVKWETPKDSKKSSDSATKSSTRKTRRKTKAQREAELEQDARAAATYTVDAVQTLGIILGGEEFQFIHSEEHGINEREGGIQAFQRYYEEKGITDIPPGIAVTLWVIAYAGARTQMPKTKTRLQKGWSSLRKRLFQGVGKKFGRKREPKIDPETGEPVERKKLWGIL